MNSGIEPSEFDPGVCGGEPPVDADAPIVPLLGRVDRPAVYRSSTMIEAT